MAEQLGPVVTLAECVPGAFVTSATRRILRCRTWGVYSVAGPVCQAPPPPMVSPPPKPSISPNREPTLNQPSTNPEPTLNHPTHNHPQPHPQHPQPPTTTPRWGSMTMPGGGRYFVHHLEKLLNKSQAVPGTCNTSSACIPCQDCSKPVTDRMLNSCSACCAMQQCSNAAMQQCSNAAMQQCSNAAMQQCSGRAQAHARRSRLLC